MNRVSGRTTFMTSESRRWRTIFLGFCGIVGLVALVSILSVSGLGGAPAWSRHWGFNRDTAPFGLGITGIEYAPDEVKVLTDVAPAVGSALGALAASHNGARAHFEEIVLEQLRIVVGSLTDPSRPDGRT